MLLVSDTTVPPLPAGPLRVTVAVELFPPWTVVGLNVSEVRTAGVIVSVAVIFWEFRTAPITAPDWVFTPVVEIVNVDDVCPAGIVREEGTVANELPLESETIVPPVAAGPFKVTVPVAEPPPNTVVGLRVRDASVGGVIVRFADCVGDPVKPAEMAATVWVLTPTVVIANVPLTFPGAMVTEPGTVAATFPLVSATTIPLGPAGPLRATVPVEGVPPRTDVGFRDNEESDGAFTVRLAVFETPFDVAVMVATVCESTAFVAMENVAEV